MPILLVTEFVYSSSCCGYFFHKHAKRLHVNILEKKSFYYITQLARHAYLSERKKKQKAAARKKKIL